MFSVHTQRPDTDLGFMYICESSVDDPSITQIGDVQIVNKKDMGIFFASFESTLQSFDVKNRNGRYYLLENVREAINTPRIQDLLADNAWYGEMNHPEPVYKGKEFEFHPKRIMEPLPQNRSHKIIKPRFEGNLLKARIETASGTDAGVGFAKEIVQGLTPRFSARSIASLKQINGRPTVIMKYLVTYDWVFRPSHAEAGPDRRVKPILEAAEALSSKQFCTVTGEDTFCQLKDFLAGVATTDDNIQLVCESLDIDIQNLVGISLDKNYGIIVDGDNTIYAKINPKTKHRVDDFYNSFGR